MAYSERDMQTSFTRWAKFNWPKKAAVFELKICHTKRFNFHKIESHQLMNLTKVKHEVVFYKIPDVGFDQKPMDFVALHGESYLVLLFYVPRQPKTCYFIDIDEIQEALNKGLISINEKEASDLASLSVVIK